LRIPSHTTQGKGGNRWPFFHMKKKGDRRTSPRGGTSASSGGEKDLNPSSLITGGKRIKPMERGDFARCPRWGREVVEVTLLFDNVPGRRKREESEAIEGKKEERPPHLLLPLKQEVRRVLSFHLISPARKRKGKARFEDYLAVYIWTAEGGGGIASNTFFSTLTS